MPEPDPTLLEAHTDEVELDDILSPALSFLTKAIDLVKVEEDTAFVIMPFRPPFSSYFATFYRPSLEEAGYRAFRAWGGLSDEDYADLLLRLIAKSGMVWADVSELNYNVLYEIGAAHALGKISILVVREEDENKIPANIGHDAISRYSPSAEDWPEGAILEKSTVIALMRDAAERGQRLRVSPGMVEASIKEIGDQLFRVIIPKEARDAAEAGQSAMANHEYEKAERSFSDAIELGLNDEATKYWLGLAREALQKEPEAMQADEKRGPYNRAP